MHNRTLLGLILATAGFLTGLPLLTIPAFVLGGMEWSALNRGERPEQSVSAITAIMLLSSLGWLVGALYLWMLI